MDKLAFSILELCRSVGIGRTTAYEEIRSGRLKVIKVGKRTLITAEELQRWLESLPHFQPGSDGTSS